MSLHTRYRPTSWGKVLGQDEAVKNLQRAVTKGKAHAFLFSGPSGTGKTTLARILAAAFARGQGTVANVEEVAAADNTGVDAMREVIRRTLYRAIGKSPIKAIIVDECHRLSGAAWDVLLKPIEEPPAHVFWMFCTTNPAKLPKTISQRVQRYELKPVSEELILGLLCDVADAEALTTSDVVLTAIAEAAAGSPRQALVFLELCAEATSANAARRMMQTAMQAKEPVDLARLLISRQGASWPAALKLINAMEQPDAETCRIIVANYLAGCLAKSKSENEAKNLLRILECFKDVYVTSDKLAPLFMSVGLALGLDQ